VLADPQSVTVFGTASTLPRLEERSDTNVYSDRTNGVDFYVTQKVDKKNTMRASVSLVKSVIVTDSITGLKSKVPYSVNINTVQPLGVLQSDVEALYDAITTALGASTKALLKKILNGER